MAGNSPKNTGSSATKLGRYQGEFFERLDGRTRAVREYRRRLAALMADAGGEAAMSYQQRALAKRAIHLEARIEALDAATARGEAVEAGTYGLLVNGLHGLLKSLGLPRKTKPVSIEDFLSG